MRLTEMRVQVEKRGGGVAADGALLGLAGPEVDRVDVAREGTCGERQTESDAANEVEFMIDCVSRGQVFLRATGCVNLAAKCGDHATSCPEMYTL